MVLDAALTQPILCDYSGHYFCSECHWGNLSVIPSRVVLNWDFQEFPVSKGSKQYLKLMMKKSIINLELINPKLFFFVEELAYVKVNKIYVEDCKMTVTIIQINWILASKKRFYDNEGIYSNMQRCFGS